VQIEVEAEEALGAGEGAGRGGGGGELRKGDEGKSQQAEEEAKADSHGIPPRKGGIKIAEGVVFFKE